MKQNQIITTWSLTTLGSSCKTWNEQGRIVEDRGSVMCFCVSLAVYEVEEEQIIPIQGDLNNNGNDQ